MNSGIGENIVRQLHVFHRNLLKQLLQLLPLPGVLQRKNLFDLLLLHLGAFLFLKPKPASHQYLLAPFFVLRNDCIVVQSLLKDHRNPPSDSF